MPLHPEDLWIAAIYGVVAEVAFILFEQDPGRQDVPYLTVCIR